MENSDVKPDLQPYEGQCPVHGKFISEQMITGFGAIKKGCPHCMADRKAKQAEADAHQAARLAADAERRDIERRRASGVPLRYDSKTLNAYRAESVGQQKALAAARRIVEAILAGQEAPNLIFSGAPGTGKSHLSCGIILELYKRFNVCRIDLPDLIREIRATWRRDSQRSEESVLNWYGTLDLLILEEIGTGAGSDDEKARVFQVMNRRYESMLPTILVSNLSVPELEKEAGERVVDRMREGDRSLVIFDWESMRAEI